MHSTHQWYRFWRNRELYRTLSKKILSDFYCWRKIKSAAFPVACSRRSDSGERCKVKGSAFSTPHRSPLSERLEQATFPDDTNLIIQK